TPLAAEDVQLLEEADPPQPSAAQLRRCPGVVTVAAVLPQANFATGERRIGGDLAVEEPGVGDDLPVHLTDHPVVPAVQPLAHLAQVLLAVVAHVHARKICLGAADEADLGGQPGRVRVAFRYVGRALADEDLPGEYQHGNILAD